MQFIKGLDLARMLYEEEIQPLMAQRFPQLRYAAATLGMCSEVLGLDDEVSMDHEWGPRISIFVSEDDHARCAAEVLAALQQRLPTIFRGLPMAWRTPGVALHDTRESVLYHVSARTVSSALAFCGGAAALPLKDLDWLGISEQHLLEFTAGVVYRDDYGELTHAREALRYYPDNVLRFLLMHEWGAVNACWFPVGRMGARGDALGVRLQAARAALHLMRIAFMLSRSYYPYEKWFGTWFSLLPLAEALQPLLQSLLTEAAWQKVEERICEASAALLERQNLLAIAPTVPVEIEPLDDGRHHRRCGFRNAWSVLAESIRPPLDALARNQLPWLHERSLIVSNDQVGKRSLLLQQ